MKIVKNFLAVVVVQLLLLLNCDQRVDMDGNLKTTITFTMRPYTSSSSTGVSFYGSWCYDVKELLVEPLEEANMSLNDHFKTKWNEISILGSGNLPVQGVDINFRVMVQSQTVPGTYHLFLKNRDQISIEDFWAGNYNMYVSDRGRVQVETAMRESSRELLLLFQLTFADVGESALAVEFFDTDFNIPFRIMKLL